MTNMKKYAPVTMREIVIEDEDIKQRIEDYADGLRTGHVLMHGPKGTGKSSAANVCQSALKIDPLSARKIDPPFGG